MPRFEFVTVDVFTQSEFGGNPLAVFPEAAGLTAAQMQSLAAELNLSETAFVLPPSTPSHRARVRIFNRAYEMDFAGHPMIGTAYVLSIGRTSQASAMKLEVAAGIVPVELRVDDRGSPTGASIEAPLPLAVGNEMPAELVGACLGIGSEDVLTSTHAPLLASMGNEFVIAELVPGALDRCEPDIVEFRKAAADLPALRGRVAIYVYERCQRLVDARMFAPLAGTWEDPATGSAAAPLAGMLLSGEGGDRLRVEIRQGINMGRPSLITAEARRAQDGIRSTVSGCCVQMFNGYFDGGERA